MNPAPGVNKPGDTQTAPPAALLTWPIGVQVALGLIVTASLFFLLGRWSQGEPRPQPETIAAVDRISPALDLNLATKAELRLIPGLGEALAQRVVDHRDWHGPFRKVDELRRVAGIGPKTLDRLRHHFFVTPQESFVADDDGENMSAQSKPRTVTVSKKGLELTAPINVNRASQAELQKLPGIGPKLSQRILDERSKASFKSIDDLRRVSGIGPKTLEKLRPYVTIDEARAVASAVQE